ncbi:MAG: STAS-like domain-containing protein [Clostridium sp.]|uniref:STAS-like domain-containing protein n=1 Tax=Clostridium sp. DSM 8431 TaxID=1761781 RepID=UPI0008E52E17|nr:STAS-like domain-containing protein [Clostridium sp. DSM 8431]MCR4945025.1 STAS-like domain-containing protein [Clostridium sp.]SFU60737.1 protein of unknown function [Clostridium sp. DSM 8431]
MEIKIREFLGENFNVEDAILLRREIKGSADENIVLDFEGVEDVPATFFNCLFGDVLYGTARKEIFERINVKNLSRANNYMRVVLGTAFQN